MGVVKCLVVVPMTLFGIFGYTFVAALVVGYFWTIRYGWLVIAFAVGVFLFIVFIVRTIWGIYRESRSNH